MDNRPPLSVLGAFGVKGELQPLSGGEGRCWRAGALILKPEDSEESWSWWAEHLQTVETKGFRIPLPVPAKNGTWVVEGWCAQEAVEGVHPREGRWGEVLQTGERFHRAIAHLPRPPFLDDRTDPWSVGDRVAWEEENLQFEDGRLKRLLEERRPILAPCQLIHGDLTENVLFSPQHSPAVIDMSPYWRPPTFAAAIVVADAVCWRRANASALMNHVEHLEDFSQFLIRALIFRMVTTLVFSSVPRSLSGYDPGIDLALKLLETTEA